MGIKGFRNIRQIKETQNIPFLYGLILKFISNKRLGETEDSFSNRSALAILELYSVIKINSRRYSLRKLRNILVFLTI